MTLHSRKKIKQPLAVLFTNHQHIFSRKLSNFNAIKSDLHKKEQLNLATQSVNNQTVAKVAWFNVLHA